LNDYIFDAPGAQYKELNISKDYARSQIESSSLRKLKKVV